MGRPKKPKLFADEGALCEAFIAALPPGWTPYAETAGFDILLVRVDGFQVGVQAKVRLNLEVINQALEDFPWGGPRGPDCRAVLVPEDARPWGKILAHVGVTVVRMGRPARGIRCPFRPGLPMEDPVHGSDMWTRDWHEMLPIKRCLLPEYVPDVPAGVRSPLQLTEWKIKALKLAALMEDRGFVTRRDFAHLGLDHRRWVSTQWLAVEGGRWVRGPRWPGFERRHQVVYKQVVADMDKWAPAASQFDLPISAPRLPL